MLCSRYLIGTENRGLNHMFTFINTSRLGTAVQGIAAAEGSYQNALAYVSALTSLPRAMAPVVPHRHTHLAHLLVGHTRRYAKDRLAMRSLTGPKNPSGPADPIIVHPDVRRMLLTMKAVAEGGRAMVYECALLTDLMMEAQLKGDEKGVKAVDDKMGFLTPILKGFLTEVGIEAASMGVQVYGGHGCVRSTVPIHTQHRCTSTACHLYCFAL